MKKSELTIWHNPRCSKSRAALEILEAHAKKTGVTFSVVDYLKTPPSPGELKATLAKLKMSAKEIVRTGEDLYEELGLDKSPPKSEDAYIALLSKNPILIERPIIICGSKAVIGRPPEKVKDVL